MLTRTDATVSAGPSRYDLNGGRVAFATLVFFVGFGANSLRNAFTWWGWGVVVAVIVVAAVVWMTRAKAWPKLRHLPIPLAAFIVYALLSETWSQWRPETLMGNGANILLFLVAMPLATIMSWDELLVAFSGAMRWVIGLSLAFELWVSLVIRHPILPSFITWTTWDKSPLQYLWSRDLLFVDGKIQGIVGNSSILAAVAAVGLIAVCVQLAARRMGRGWGIFWIVVMLGVLVMTRDATMAIALVVTGLVLVAILIRRRITGFLGRVLFLVGVVVIVVVGAIAVSHTWKAIFALLGKDSDLTGRTTIWANTISLAVQHPWFGWGWLSYWPPWLTQLNHLNVRYGVAQLHAHDAWIDLWMQVGIIGAVIFALIVIVAWVRSYRASITPVWIPELQTERLSAVALFPVLLLTLLIVQSLTESRLINEEGFMTLAILSTKLKLMPFTPRRWGATLRA